ncbi:hypothetical protein ALT717_100054 [Alteromonas macleodii]
MKALIALTSIVGFLMVVLPGPLYQYAGEQDEQSQRSSSNP